MSHWNWGIVLILAGCATLKPTVGREVDLVVYPRVSGAPLNAQAVLNPNTLETIATLDVIPYVEVSSGSYSPISQVTGNPTTVGAADMLKLSQPAPVDPSRPFVLRKLKPNKNYRIWARAYNSGNSLISRDTTSYVDVAVGTDDSPPMATLPVNLTDTPFGASVTLSILNEGRYDTLKATLYLVPNNTPLAIAQTTRTLPQLTFGNLQGATTYKLVAEAYKLGTMMASNSINLAITNDTAPATASLSLSIPYVTTTLAGNGTIDYVEGQGALAQFREPRGIAVDLQGNIYLADRDNHCIRKITPGGLVSTFAGNGTAGFANGVGTAASFYTPYGLAFDTSGNLFVADYGNHSVRKITSGAEVTTFAGNGTSASVDGTGTSAQFMGPLGILVDSLGNVFVSDYSDYRIRRITSTGVVSTFVGSGTAGFLDAQGPAAKLDGPVCMALDSLGNLFFLDYKRGHIRKITPGGQVSLFAGSGSATGYADGTGTAALFNQPWGLTIDPQDNLYLTDSSNHRVRKVTPLGVVSTLAGNGTNYVTDGTGTAATFNAPCGIIMDAQGNLYVGDGSAHRVRKLQ